MRFAVEYIQKVGRWIYQDYQHNHHLP
jgi:hypothetical protein